VVERSPSSALLLPHAEHSAAQAGALAHPDGYPDAPGLEAAVLDPRPAGEVPSNPSAWDASDAAPQDAAEAAEHPPRHLADAGVGKSAVLVLDALEPVAPQLDAQPPPTPVVQAQPDAVAELCKPDAVRSAEQSFAVPGPEERWEPAAQPDAALAPAEPQTQPAMVQPELAAQLLQPRAAVVVLPDAVGPRPEARAQYEQASLLLWGPQPERRERVQALQPRALEQTPEQVQRALLAEPAEPPQVSPQPAALGEVATEPLPLLSFE
jgi:hypothetical protein